MKNMIGKTFKNTSGKRIQVPNRISDEFCWQPGERIKIYADLNGSPGQDAFLVENLDYSGVHKAHYSAWIDNDTLSKNFTEIK